jgi:hypothetical protein
MLMAVAFAAEIGGYLWLVLRPPGPLGWWRHSGAVGLGAALASGMSFLANWHHGQTGDFVVAGAVRVTAILGALAAGTVAVLLHRPHGDGLAPSLRIGVAECAWAVLLSPPAVFVVDLLTTQDDLGRATIVLTWFSLVLLLARGLAVGHRTPRPARTYHRGG